MFTETRWNSMESGLTTNFLETKIDFKQHQEYNFWSKNFHWKDKNRGEKRKKEKGKGNTVHWLYRLYSQSSSRGPCPQVLIMFPRKQALLRSWCQNETTYRIFTLWTTISLRYTLGELTPLLKDLWLYNLTLLDWEILVLRTKPRNFLHYICTFTLLQHLPSFYRKHLEWQFHLGSSHTFYLVF